MEGMSAEITVKGIRQGVLITLESGYVPDLMVQLKDLLHSRASFFRGGRVALQTGALSLTHADLSHLKQVFEKHGVEIWAVVSDNSETREAAQGLDLETLVELPVAHTEPVEPPSEEPAAMAGLFVNRTVRSGQCLSHSGYIVVFGDVNPGAELIAGGDVIVWGRLRGTVHAGAWGDADRSVCALDLSPTQLRIGNHIARPPEEKRRSKDVWPERAFVSNGQIVAERWK